MLTENAFFSNPRPHNLVLRTHSPVGFRFCGTASRPAVLCPNACDRSEPLRIPTMYDGQLTPSRQGTRVHISFLNLLRSLGKHDGPSWAVPLPGLFCSHQADGVSSLGPSEPGSDKMRCSSQRTELGCIAGIHPVDGGVREALQNIGGIGMSRFAGDHASKPSGTA